MSDNYIIETRRGAAGLVVRYRRGFLFFSATKEFDVLDGKPFATPERATAAVTRQAMKRSESSQTRQFAE